MRQDEFRQAVRLYRKRLLLAGIAWLLGFAVILYLTSLIWAVAHALYGWAVSLPVFAVTIMTCWLFMRAIYNYAMGQLTELGLRCPCCGRGLLCRRSKSQPPNGVCAGCGTRFFDGPEAC